MGFVDDLTLVLDLLILITVAVFYTGVMVWFEAGRKDLARANTHLQAGALMIGLLGGLMGVFSVWGELAWPITGFPGAQSYDLFFYDVLILLSFLLVAFALAVRSRYPTHMVGMLGAVIGLGVLFYGARAYQLSLTKDPLETLLMYMAFAGVSVMAYPTTLFVDWFVVGPTVPATDPLPSHPTPDYPWLWRILLGIFLASVVLAGVAAVLYGVDAAWAHLASPP